LILKEPDNKTESSNCETRMLNFQAVKLRSSACEETDFNLQIASQKLQSSNCSRKSYTKSNSII